MASTNTQWHNERRAPKKGGKHDVSQIDLMAAKLEVLTKKIEKLQPTANVVNAKEVICEYCAENHRGVDCVKVMNYGQQEEEVNFVGNKNRYQNFKSEEVWSPRVSLMQQGRRFTTHLLTPNLNKIDSINRISNTKQIKTID